MSKFINVVEIQSSLEKRIAQLDNKTDFVDAGYVVSVADGVAKVDGLEKVGLGECVRFVSGQMGMVMSLEDGYVMVAVLDLEHVKVGDLVERTKRVVSVLVGKGLLGRIVDSLGRPLDGKGPINSEEFREVDVRAPGVMERKSVHEPLHTGTKAIDALIPIGRGQRELILGDRQTGKTSIAIDAILNQKTDSMDASEKVYCIYVAIGQRAASVARVHAQFEQMGAMEYTTIVCASSSESPAMQFLAPYSGCAIGEYYRDNGMHALIVYDDLTKHANANRQLSLLLRRPPAREAYSADVFYLHARLLERAAKLSDEKGAGSLTALPIIETQAGDVSAYIPTNVISITDGQIVLDADAFRKGQRPAVNVGMSVSRIGSAAQTSLMKQASKGIKLDLAQYSDLEHFAQFGSDLDDATKTILNRGRALMASLRQRDGRPQSVAEQVVALYVAKSGHLDEMDYEEVERLLENMISRISVSHSGLLRDIELSGVMSEEHKQSINEVLKEVSEIRKVASPVNQ